MKAKTKDQLRADIFALQMKRGVQRRALEDAKDKTVSIFRALSGALRSTLTHEPNSYEVLVSFVTTFFAELKRLTGLDFARDESLEALETLCDMMGFDKITTTIIKQRIPVYFEISKMIHQGTREEEILEFARKCKGAEGRR